MRNRILSTIIAAVSSLAISAQGVCTISGTIADTQLDNGKKIKKVYLTRTNEFGQAVEVATAKVKKGCYTFNYALAQNEPVMQYTLTGFGEDKGIVLFVEPGEVAVSTASAVCPEQSIVAGTPTNDTYAAYRAICDNGEDKAAQEIAALEQQHGKEWLATAEGKNAVKRIKAREAIKTEAEVMRFLIEHNASPMTPLVVERTLLPKLSEAYAEQMSKAISTSLHEHPYYLSLLNTVLANSLKVGNIVPDITLPLLSGETKHLNDYRGKYIILNYWTPGSEKSAEMLAELKNVYDVVKDEKDYIILSFALTTDVEAWKQEVEVQGLDREGWLNACDGVGAHSPAAKRYGVEEAPRIVFIEPEGHAISLDMELDEIIMRIEQIMSGDLYYLDLKE